MTDSINLKPDDPTPDPEQSVPGKGTTFREVVDLAKEAAGKIDASDGIDAEEVVEAALGAAGKVLPLKQHALTELRKLLVPIVTAIITAIAAGGFAEWRAGAAKDQAVQEVEQRALDLEKIRTEIRKALLKDASWDEVGATLNMDEPGAAKKALTAYTEAFGKDAPGGSPVDLKKLEDLVHNEAQQIQLTLPPKPSAAAQPQ